MMNGINMTEKGLIKENVPVKGCIGSWLEFH